MIRYKVHAPHTLKIEGIDKSYRPPIVDNDITSNDSWFLVRIHPRSPPASVRRFKIWRQQYLSPLIRDAIPRGQVDLLKKVSHLGGRGPPSKALDPLASPVHEGSTNLMDAEDMQKLVCQVIRILQAIITCRLTADLTCHWDIGGNDRYSAGHGLDKRQTESFDIGRKDQARRASVELGHALVRHC
jgi:hypothetical protein